METIKLTKKLTLAFIFLAIGGILIISSFFIPDIPMCGGPIFTSSFFVFAIGMLFLMMGIALGDVEYHNQTKWIIKRNHKNRKY